MDSARFSTLADAYGAAIGRWPKAERLGAWQFALGHPIHARGVLVAARRIDQLLGHSAAPICDQALVNRIERICREHEFRPTAQSRPLRGWLGAGLAMAAAAGAVAGIAITPLAIRIAPAFNTVDPLADATTALGEPNELGEI